MDKDGTEEREKERGRFEGEKWCAITHQPNYV